MSAASLPWYKNEDCIEYIARAGGVILAILLLIALSGCATAPPPAPPTKTPVCHVLIGPIHYNTYKPDSRRYAGPDLAPDLKARNQVGQNLHCPAYK